MKVYEIINTFDFYLESRPYEIGIAKKIVDNTVAMYPTYYTVKDKKLFFSNSAFALSKMLGSFNKNINQDFKIVNKIPTSYQTRDKRVFRVKPFYSIEMAEEKIVKKNNFSYSLTIENREKYFVIAAELFMKVVHFIERKYPKVKYIVEVGGKDSQLILLIPKLNSENWYVFSGKPNAQIVREFIEKNGIKISGFFSDKGKTLDEVDNEYEDKNFIREKIIASDSLIALKTLQWGKIHKEQLKRYFPNHVVFFWDGSTGGNLNTSLELERISLSGSPDEIRKRFYYHLFNHSPLYQGLYHQYNKNLGFPTIDLYSFSEVWKNLYSKYDPLMLKNYDARKEIGDIIFGKSVKWIDKNPGPPQWDKQDKYNIQDIYIEELTKREEPKDMMVNTR